MCKPSFAFFIKWAKASVIALFIALAPCDPPKISTHVSLPRSFVSMSKNSPRTGFPVTTPFEPKNGNASSNVNAALSINLASLRLVKPGKAFESITSVGIRIKLAINTMGPETYPPAPTTTSGLNSRNSLRASRKLCGKIASPFNFPANPTFFKPTLFISDN